MVKKALGSEFGNQMFSPFTQEKIELEATRFDGILNSIKKRDSRYYH